MSGPVLTPIGRTREPARVALPPDCASALAALARRAGPEAFEAGATPEFTPQPACAAAVDAICAALDADGVAVVTGLALDTSDAMTEAGAAWALAASIGRIVAQTQSGVRLYHVRDEGVALAPGVRRSITNLGQAYHTDGGWLDPTPALAALACLRQAGRGGVNRVVSLVEAHDRLQARAPELLARLYRPFCWDRQAEHEIGAPAWSERPVFERRDGRIEARWYEDYVRKGHVLAGQPLDEDGGAALTALRSALDACEGGFELRLERGQMLVMDNRRMAHSRTAFEDGAGGLGRHLLRLWMREEGGPDLEG